MLTRFENRPHALDVIGVSVAFGEVCVIDNVSFHVDVGSTLAIVGRNGSGKTVLLKALIGAVRASGTVRWAPETRIGYVPQKLDIQRDLPLTGRDFLDAKVDVTHAPATDAQRVAGLVNLSQSIVDQPIGTLSGGQFQRLLLAFALVGTPSVLLFDEPTAGVDEPEEKSVYALIHQLQQNEGLSVLVISHDMTQVQASADHILFLSHHGSYFGKTADMLSSERLQELHGPTVAHLRE